MEDGSVKRNIRATSMSFNNQQHIIANSFVLLLFRRVFIQHYIYCIYIIKMSSNNSEIFNRIMNLRTDVCCYSPMNSW